MYYSLIVSMIKRSHCVSAIVVGVSHRIGDGSADACEPEGEVAAPAMALTIVTPAATR